MKLEKVRVNAIKKMTFRESRKDLSYRFNELIISEIPEFKNQYNLCRIELNHNFEFDKRNILNDQFNIFTIFKEIKRRLLSHRDKFIDGDSVKLNPDIRKYRSILDDLDSNLFNPLLYSSGIKLEQLTNDERSIPIDIDGKRYIVIYEDNEELKDLAKSYSRLYKIISALSIENDNDEVVSYNNFTLMIYCRLDEDGYIDLSDYLYIDGVYRRRNREHRKVEKNVDELYPMKNINSVFNRMYLNYDDMCSFHFLYEKNQNRFYGYFSHNNIYGNRSGMLGDLIKSQLYRDNIFFKGYLGRNNGGNVNSLYIKLLDRIFKTKKVNSLLTEEARIELDACLIKMNTKPSYELRHKTHDILVSPKSFKDGYRLIISGTKYIRFAIVKCDDDEVGHYDTLIYLQSVLINHLMMDHCKGYIMELDMSGDTIKSELNNKLTCIPVLKNNTKNLIDFAEDIMDGDFYSLTKYPGINMM